MAAWYTSRNSGRRSGEVLVLEWSCLVREGRMLEDEGKMEMRETRSVLF
jgi:hypothetical protein